jgi:hypothetical protein
MMMAKQGAGVIAATPGTLACVPGCPHGMAVAQRRLSLRQNVICGRTAQVRPRTVRDAPPWPHGYLRPRLAFAIGESP